MEWPRTPKSGDCADSIAALQILGESGEDPQLEEAIHLVLSQLEASPPATPKRPPFPVRVRP